MPGDPKKYNEHAERCLELASQAWDPVLKENLTQAAQRWTRLKLSTASMRRLGRWWRQRAPYFFLVPKTEIELMPGTTANGIRTCRDAIYD
jgi:hypothetical protein